MEKYGMLVGGVDMHRYDLSSMVMLKDNHIWSTGSITNAVAKARSVCGFSQRIDVEVQSYDEAVEAIEAGADVIMLDNMRGHQLVECARKLKHGYHVSSNASAKGRQFLLESSGGIDVDNVGGGGHVDDGALWMQCAPLRCLADCPCHSHRHHQHQLHPSVHQARRLFPEGGPHLEGFRRRILSVNQCTLRMLWNAVRCLVYTPPCLAPRVWLSCVWPFAARHELERGWGAA